MRDKAGRAVVAAALLVLGAFGTARSLGSALEPSTDRTYDVALGDARLIAAKAERLVGVDATAADRLMADMLARRALRRDPTVVSAAATLGIDADMAGRAGEAARFRRYAQMLSRRDLRVQLWSIEAAVAAGDYRGALHHYDEALRTQRAAADLLFPILNGAAADPLIRQALADLLIRQPPWARAYLVQLANSAEHSDTAAMLVAQLSRTTYRLPPPVIPLLIETLIKQDQIERAWRFYVLAHPGADRTRLRNGTFSAIPVQPTSFDWQLMNTADVTIDIDDKRSRMNFSTGGDTGGMLARQLQVLPAGRYQLQTRGPDDDAPRSGNAYWHVICTDGRELGRANLPASGAISGGGFVVPRNCPAQWLEFDLFPSDSGAGSAGSVRSVSIIPR